MQKKLRGNVVKFSDEYGRYLDFQVTLLAAIADAQASYSTGGPPDEIDSTDFKRKTFDIKALLTQALKTDFISLVYDGLTNDWRLAAARCDRARRADRGKGVAARRTRRDPRPGQPDAAVFFERRCRAASGERSDGAAGAVEKVKTFGADESRSRAYQQTRNGPSQQCQYPDLASAVRGTADIR